MGVHYLTIGSFVMFRSTLKHMFKIKYEYLKKRASKGKVNNRSTEDDAAFTVREKQQSEVRRTPPEAAVPLSRLQQCMRAVYHFIADLGGVMEIVLLDIYSLINLMLQIMTLLSVISYNKHTTKYLYIWTPTFLHILHARRMLMTIMYARWEALDPHRDQGDAKLKELALELLSAILIWVCVLEQTTLDDANPDWHGPVQSMDSNTSGSSGSGSFPEDDDNGSLYASIGDQYSFLQALYFVITTLTTTGYGDLLPGYGFGMVMVVGLMVHSMYILATKVPKLFAIFSQRQLSGGRYSVEHANPRHIVILGGDFEASYLQDFLLGILAQSKKWNDTEPPRIVVLSQHENLAVKEAFNTVRWVNRFQYIRGTAMEPNDLERASVKTADGVFIFVDRRSTNPNKEDSDAILRARAVLSHSKTTKLFVQIILPINEHHFRDHENVVTIPISECRNALLAGSCLVPGFSTLLSELVHSVQSSGVEKKIMQSLNRVDDELEKLLNQKVLHTNEDTDARRAREAEIDRKQHAKRRLKAAMVYADCSGGALFCSILNQADPADCLRAYIGRAWDEAALEALTTQGICLIGVELLTSEWERNGEVLAKKGEIVLNPIAPGEHYSHKKDEADAAYTLQNGDRLFYISEGPANRLQGLHTIVKKPQGSISQDELLGVQRPDRSSYVHRGNSQTSTHSHSKMNVTKASFEPSFAFVESFKRKFEDNWEEAMHRKVISEGPMMVCTAESACKELGIDTKEFDQLWEVIMLRKHLDSLKIENASLLLESSTSNFHSEAGDREIQDATEQLQHGKDKLAHDLVSVQILSLKKEECALFEYNGKRLYYVVKEKFAKVTVLPAEKERKRIMAAYPKIEQLNHMWLGPDMLYATAGTHASKLNDINKAYTKLVLGASIPTIDLRLFVEASISKEIRDFGNSFILVDCFFTKQHTDVEHQLPVTSLLKHLDAKRSLHQKREHDSTAAPIVMIIPKEMELNVREEIIEHGYENVYYFCGHIATSGKRNASFKQVLEQCDVMLRVRAGAHGEYETGVNNALDRYLQDSLNLTHVGRLHEVLDTDCVKTRVITEMLFRSNFAYAYATIKVMRDADDNYDVTMDSNLLYQYTFGVAYQGGAMLCDTLSDTLLAQAFLCQRSGSKGTDPSIQQEVGRDKQAASYLSVFRLLLGTGDVSAVDDIGAIGMPPQVSALLITGELIKEIRTKLNNTVRSHQIKEEISSLRKASTSKSIKHQNSLIGINISDITEAAADPDEEEAERLTRNNDASTEYYERWANEDDKITYNQACAVIFVDLISLLNTAIGSHTC
jgi:hypothetical protein